jgi:hypothetical protein
MIPWEFPKPPDLDLEFPGAPKAWLRAIQQWASKEEFIDAIYLFGSRLRGTFHEGSDLDLAILLSLSRALIPARTGGSTTSGLTESRSYSPSKQT